MNGVVVAEGGRGLVAFTIYGAGGNGGLPGAKAAGQEAKLVSER
jgi:hypothetical protein